jgi:hypothetical protein
VAGKFRKLLKWAKELKSKKAHLAGRLLAEHLGDNGRGLAGNEAGGGWSRSWNGEMDSLIGAQDVGGGNTRTSSTNIESFCELDEFSTRDIGPAQEDRHLETNSRRASRRRRPHVLLLL